MSVSRMRCMYLELYLFAFTALMCIVSSPKCMSYVPKLEIKFEL
jgi:hypothetical protein